MDWRGHLLAGAEGLERIAAEAPAELVLVATVGWTGLPPALAALRAGRALALANKEVLVCGGHLVMEEARRRDLQILPVDSEHNAIFQCLAAAAPSTVKRIILTCSGGPYRNATREEIAIAPRDRTLRHPTWSMGAKITVDSATLMNKGFEVIEAHHLFGVGYDHIDVVIHPESTVHSLVEYVDGSLLAQLGPTDMRFPIQFALTWPDRLEAPAKYLDLTTISSLHFAAPDLDRFPALRMAYDAGRAGGSAPCVLNAANEVAVALHLAGDIPCGGVPEIVGTVIRAHTPEAAPSLESLRKWDLWGREEARRVAREIREAARA